MMSTAVQRKMIGFLRKQLKIDADTYYDILASYGVKSSKELRYFDAESILKNLKSKAAQMGVYTPKSSKYQNLDSRLDMASAKQLRYIEVLFKSYSFIKNDAARETALGHFLEKLTGVSHLRFLTRTQASLVIRRLEK